VVDLCGFAGEALGVYPGDVAVEDQDYVGSFDGLVVAEAQAEPGSGCYQLPNRLIEGWAQDLRVVCREAHVAATSVKHA
jgi:hypothetical protein